MLVCIDFDGVIADSLLQQLAVVRAAQLRLGLGRVPELEDFRKCENLSYLGFGELIGIPVEAMPRWKSELEIEFVAATSAPFFTGMVDALEQIASKSHLAIITSNVASVVEIAFAEHGMCSPPIFDLHFALDKTKKIIAAAEKLGERLDSTYMVGDTRGDIRHGKSAGVKTIAVTWGYHTKEALAAERPDFFADSPAELLRILGIV